MGNRPQWWPEGINQSTFVCLFKLRSKWDHNGLLNCWQVLCTKEVGSMTVVFDCQFRNCFHGPWGPFAQDVNVCDSMNLFDPMHSNRFNNHIVKLNVCSTHAIVVCTLCRNTDAAGVVDAVYERFCTNWCVVSDIPHLLFVCASEIFYQEIMSGPENKDIIKLPCKFISKWGNLVWISALSVSASNALQFREWKLQHGQRIQSYEKPSSTETYSHLMNDD